MPTDDRNGTDDGSKGTGLIRTVLTDVFETIADMDSGERRRGLGTAREGKTRFDYGFDVGVGSESRQTDGDVRTLDGATGTEPDHAAAIQPTKAGYVATIDLPDVDPSELAAGVNGDARTLVVADDGGVVGRFSVPDGDLEVGEASYNNGVLDVRLDATGRDE